MLERQWFIVSQIDNLDFFPEHSSQQGGFHVFEHKGVGTFACVAMQHI